MGKRSKGMEEKNFGGLTIVNVELTSRCSKSCWICGRRKIERDYPELANWGDMDFKLVEKIAKQIPEGIVVQFHNNGEPLLYPRFGEAVSLFKEQIKCVDTNGKLVVEKADEIINNLDTITFSIFENDSEEKEQYELIKQFLDIKKDKKPFVVYRCLGNVDTQKYERLQGIVASRILHHPMGSFGYEKKVTIPEIGICLDLLSHLVIDRFGDVSPCVRFDPKRVGIIGNANKTSLIDIWGSPERKMWIEYHIRGKRDKLPLCRQCEYWGIPRGI